jgi:hypothetical protein
MVPSSPFVSMTWAMAGWITDGGRVADLAWKSQHRASPAAFLSSMSQGGCMTGRNRVRRHLEIIHPDSAGVNPKVS